MTTTQGVLYGLGALAAVGTGVALTGTKRKKRKKRACKGRGKAGKAGKSTPNTLTVGKGKGSKRYSLKASDKNKTVLKRIQKGLSKEGKTGVIRKFDEGWALFTRKRTVVARKRK